VRVLLSLLVLVQLNSLLISRTAGHYSRLTITWPRHLWAVGDAWGCWRWLYRNGPAEL